MLIYKITSVNSVIQKKFLANKFADISNLMLKEIHLPSANRPEKNSKIDWAYMLNRSNFKISEYDINNYFAHKSAWEDLVESTADWALVIEDEVELKKPLSAIKEEVNSLLHWDVYFPYDYSSKISDEFSNGNSPFILDVEWGSFVYFVSKKGAEKLLKLTQIRQPVGEEILFLSLNEQLETFTHGSGFFTIPNINEIAKEDRRKSIKEAIFNSNAWTPITRKKVRELIFELCLLCIEIEVEISLFAGSLLGFVRHGEIMPWDDDVDLAIDERDLKKLLIQIDSCGTLQYSKLTLPGRNWYYYKFWAVEGEKIEGYNYNFPFVDVWIYNIEKTSVVFKGGEIFPKEIYFPLQKADFEGSILSIPYDPKACLDQQYSDWKTKIKVYPWSHRLEKAAFNPLSLCIETDEKGRFIDS